MVPGMRAFPLAAIFLMALFASIPNDPATMPAAAEEDEELQHFRSWTIGDFWRYDKTPSGANNAKTSGEITYRVQSVERVTNHRFFDAEIHDPDWQHHQVFRLKVWANQTANSGMGPTIIKTEQERFHRTKDLGLAQTHALSKYHAVDDPSQSGRSERYHEYFPPQVEIEFPFAVGDKWRVATGMRNHNPGNDCGGEGAPPCNTTSNKINTYTVMGTQTLHMTLNGQQQEVFTYRIHVLDDLGIEDANQPDQKKYSIWWWSPETCNTVLREDYSARRTLKETWTLTEYQCAGRDAPDPSYASYDFQNFSSMRRHGALAVPEKLAQLNDMDPAANGGGNLIQLGENLPAPGFLLVAGALVALAAAVRRKR